MATWTGQGIAHYSVQKRRDVGSVFCRTPLSTSGKLGFLNNMGTNLLSLYQLTTTWPTSQKST
jgi:hypothetical protein